MEKIMKYSVLRYSPTIISGEQINLGIIFDAPADNYREFRYTKKFNRLTSFDDEIDINIVKALMRNIKEDVEGTVMSSGVFDIEEYVKFFINDFHFEKPKKILYDDIREVTESVNKTYFRFDYDKKDRPTGADDKRMFARLIRDSGKSVQLNQKVSGKFDEIITYDLITNDYKVKFFDFDNKDLSKSINTAKTWAWNGAHNSGKDVLIVYRYDDKEVENDVHFKSIMRILQESGIKVVDVENGLKLFQEN